MISACSVARLRKPVSKQRNIINYNVQHSRSRLPGLGCKFSAYKADGVFSKDNWISVGNL